MTFFRRHYISRAVVGWTVANRDSAELAEELIADTIYAQKVPEGQLTLHADRGADMKSKAVSQLLSDLGVEKTHSRPHVSDDNPYSESQFKTLKYHSTFPKTFPTLDEAKLFLRAGSDGITPNTNTVASRCCALKMCMMARRKRFSIAGKQF